MLEKTEIIFEKLTGGEISLTPEERKYILKSLSNQVYDVAVRYCERLEHSRQIAGSGHHLAQKMSTKVKEMLRERLEAV